MSTMIAEVYDALLAAGAPEDKARAAATAIAGYEDRFADIAKRFGQVEQRFTKVDGELALLRWMLTFNLAMTVAILWKVFV